MLRRRKTMILRMLVCRRGADPKTRPHVLCELAQAKCTSTCHKNHFKREIAGKMPRHKTRMQTSCELAQSKCISKCHKKHFMTLCGNSQENAGPQD